MYFHKYGIIFRKLFPSYLWKVDTRLKEIYLTFDDGPVPEVTEFVLDELARYGAKATFFCVGDNVVKHPAIYERLLSEGHSVGNHTFNHLNARKVDSESYLSNIAKCQEVLEDIQPKFFRPPYARLKWNHIKELKKHGYQIVMWDILTGDFDPNLNCELALKKTIQGTKCGSIVLMHDNPKHFKNMKYILPKYLAHFAQQGYIFKPL